MFVSFPFKLFSFPCPYGRADASEALINVIISWKLVMFTDGKRTFTDAEYTFSNGEHMFSDGKHKRHRGKNMFASLHR